jgi:hypothetical protein
MTTNGNETPVAPVANLRAARKELTQARAASKAAHPAGKQTPAKAPAKKAPAKNQAAKTATPKLRWQFPDGFADRSRTGQCAPFDGGMLEMRPVDGKWVARYIKAGKAETLAEGVGAGRAYDACIAFVKRAAA